MSAPVPMTAKELIGKLVFCPPDRPVNLVTYAEAAPILGITRQGVRHLAYNDEDFPHPAGLTTNGPVFLRSDIALYLVQREKKGAPWE